MTIEEAIIDIRENIQPIIGGKSLDIAISALDLITRQQAENENLKVKLQSMRGAANSLKMHYEEAQAEVERLKRELDLVIENSISARYPHCVLCGNGAILTKSLEEYDELIADISAEAYKEFAEKAKEFMHNKFKTLDEYEFEYITERDIDKLAEMQNNTVHRYEVKDGEIPDICEIKLRDSGIDVEEIL